MSTKEEEALPLAAAFDGSGRGTESATRPLMATGAAPPRWMRSRIGSEASKVGAIAGAGVGAATVGGPNNSPIVSSKRRSVSFGPLLRPNSVPPPPMCAAPPASMLAATLFMWPRIASLDIGRPTHLFNSEMSRSKKAVAPPAAAPPPPHSFASCRSFGLTRGAIAPAVAGILAISLCKRLPVRGSTSG